MMKRFLLTALFYTLLPPFYVLKVIAILLTALGIGQCTCEDMVDEKFYFTEKMLISSISLILITLYVASL